MIDSLVWRAMWMTMLLGAGCGGRAVDLGADGGPGLWTGFCTGSAARAAVNGEALDVDAVRFSMASSPVSPTGGGTNVSVHFTFELSHPTYRQLMAVFGRQDGSAPWLSETADHVGIAAFCTGDACPQPQDLQSLDGDQLEGAALGRPPDRWQVCLQGLTSRPGTVRQIQLYAPEVEGL